MAHANAKQEKIPLTPLSTLDFDNPRLVSLLPTLVSEYQRLEDEISVRKESQEDLKLMIESLVLPLQIKKIGIPDSWHVIRKQASSSSLNMQKVVEECISRGVDPVLVKDILSAATEKKLGKEYIQVVDDASDKGKNNTEAFS